MAANNVVGQLKNGLTTCMGRVGIMSFKEVARRAGVPPKSMRLSPGTRISTLIKIATALDCKVADLVSGVTD